MPSKKKKTKTMPTNRSGNKKRDKILNDTFRKDGRQAKQNTGHVQIQLTASNLII